METTISFPLLFILAKHQTVVCTVLILMFNCTWLAVEIRTVENSEFPLNLQLNNGLHQSLMELRLVQVREPRSVLPIASKNRRSKGGGSDSEESSSDESHPNIMPKEEG